MSFEGYYQFWCPKGHCEEVGYDYGNGFTDVEIRCTECGSIFEVANLVDDTNLDDYGRLPEESMPTDEKSRIYFTLGKDHNGIDVFYLHNGIKLEVK